MKEEEELDIFNDMGFEDEDNTLLEDFDADEEELDDQADKGIENLDYEEPEEKEAPPVPRPSENVEKTEKKKSSKWGFYSVLLLLLLLGFSLFFARESFKEKDESPVATENEESETDTEELSIFIDEPDLIPLPEEESRIVVIGEETSPAAPEPQPSQWHVQVALCRFQTCVDSVSERLVEMGLEVARTSFRRKFKMVHVVSSESFDETESENIMNTLAANPQKIFFPLKLPVGGKYRVSLGYFPTLENAKLVRLHVERRIFTEKVRFDMKTVNRSIRSHKMMAGPFEDKKRAEAVLLDLKNFSEFSDAFLLKSKV